MNWPACQISSVLSLCWAPRILLNTPELCYLVFLNIGIRKQSFSSPWAQPRRVQTVQMCALHIWRLHLWLCTGPKRYNGMIMLTCTQSHAHSHLTTHLITACPFLSYWCSHVMLQSTEWSSYNLYYLLLKVFVEFDVDQGIQKQLHEPYCSL